MTDTAGRPPADQLDAYLDRLLDPIASAAFERAVDDDTDLARALVLQDRVDDALRRVLSMPSSDALAGLLPAAPAAPTAPLESIGSRAGWRPWVMAASVLLTVAGVWLVWSALAPRPGPPSPYRLQAQRTIGNFYELKIDGGFSPDWRCEDDAQFREAFANQFRQPLAMRDAPAVTALGIGYCYTLSPGTMYVLAEVEGEPVIVFVDHADAVETPPLAPGGGVHMHRGRAGALVLYELSPFDTPRVIDLLFDPETAEGSP